MSKRDEDLTKIGDQVGHELLTLWTIAVYGAFVAVLLGLAGAVALLVWAVKSC